MKYDYIRDVIRDVIFGVLLFGKRMIHNTHLIIKHMKS